MAVDPTTSTNKTDTCLSCWLGCVALAESGARSSASCCRSGVNAVSTTRSTRSSGCPVRWGALPGVGRERQPHIHDVGDGQPVPGGATLAGRIATRRIEAGCKTRIGASTQFATAQDCRKPRHDATGSRSRSLDQRLRRRRFPHPGGLLAAPLAALAHGWRCGHIPTACGNRRAEGARRLRHSAEFARLLACTSSRPACPCLKGLRAAAPNLRAKLF
jgi:hypothetical protein